jgi:hypothetical protein
MRIPARTPRPGSGWRRRALVLYWIFVAAVVIGVAILTAAIELDNRPVALALVTMGLIFATLFGVVLVIRVSRGR